MITVTASPTEGGEVTGEGAYTYGETVILTATPNTGYNFVNWTIDGSVVGTALTYSFDAEGEVEVTANFAPALGIGLVASEGAVLATEYYNLQGVQIANPQVGALYIVKTIYESGATKAAKLIIK